MKPTPGYVWCLRTCKEDMTAHRGFVWPREGEVSAPDFLPTKDCGNGLHGYLWGSGDGESIRWEGSAVWQVVEVLESEIVHLGGKVKFPRCRVIFSGTRLEATTLLGTDPRANAIIGGTSTSGYGGTSTSGFGGTSTSGDSGTSTSGYYGTSTSGDGGTSTSGYGGTSTSGDSGTSTSGDYGTSTSGVGGALVFVRYTKGRNRIVVAYVGECGIEPNVAYRLDYSGKPVRA